MTRFIIYSRLIFFLLAFTMTEVVASPKEEVNLFSITDTHLDQYLSVGVEVDAEPWLRDGDTQTVTSLSGSEDSPVELVYSFGNQTVSPRQLRFKLGNSTTNLGQIEVLVSTFSSSAGFTSLRSEPIPDAISWQSFKFEQTAAKWVMIRFIPVDEKISIVISEISLHGHLGAPESNYEFTESPAEAFQVLSKLQDTVDANISEEEASMFDDARDGAFDSWTFAEAALFSSGVRNREQRLAYLSRLDQLEIQASKAVQDLSTPFQKGERLLKWLHQGELNKGYIAKQTDISKIFDTNTYNCVSSATLYNILARRLGLDVRAIEVPDHAFSIIYDGTKHADVETTTSGGFNPSRDRAAISEFQQTTGFAYIPDRHRSKRREIKETGLVAITYYNHGVDLTSKKKYHDALLNYFRALNLDPENKSAVKNALSVLSIWSLELAKTGNFEKALFVLAVGLELAPNDKGLKQNNKYVWQQNIDATLKSDGIEAALALLKDARKKTSGKDFVKMQSWVFLRQGEKFITQENWQQALALAEQGLIQVDPSVKKELEKWRAGIIIRWANKATEQQQFQLASDILEKGMAFEKPDYRVSNNLGYVAQKWSRYVADTEGIEAGDQVIAKLLMRFPTSKKVQHAASSFVDWKANKAIEQGSYEKAIKIYQQARLNNPDNYHLKSNEEATWVSWAKGYMDNRQWNHALDIYERAHASRPDARIFKQNISYIIQEWARDVSASKGNEAAEKLVSELASRFPNIKSVQNSGGKNTAQEIDKLINAGQYDQAQTMLGSSKDFFTNKKHYDDTVVRLYYHWSKESSGKGDFESAVNTYNNALDIYPGNSKLKKNMIATWSAWADSYMEVRQWKQALDVYERAHTSHPDTRLFKQNISYIVQEWSRDVAESEGNEAAEKLVLELVPRFSNIKSVQEAPGKNTVREIKKLIEAKQYQQAQTMLDSSRDLITKKRLYDNTVVNLYYHWAKGLSAKGDFESAVDIYDNALKNHTDNSGLRSNAIATWHAWAKPYLKGDQCSKAIKLYENGLLKIPDASLFKNNIRYCESKLKEK